MKLVTFRKGKQARVGVVVDGAVLDLKAAAGGKALSVPARVFDDMISLLDSGAEGMKAAAKLSASKDRGKSATALAGVKLLAPVPLPRKVFCLAGNYVEHIEECRKIAKMKDKITPRIFMKPPTNTVIGPGAPIMISRTARAVDWEVELAVVIGRKGKYISAADAYDYVAGYTVFNDVSERDLKIRQRQESEEWDKFFDWLNGKWCDSFAPIGPWLVTADEIPDPHGLRLSLSVNGEKMQDSDTGRVIHRIDGLIEYLSAFITLEPGDIIATGTPSGIGQPRGIFLKPGDTVAAEIEKIGVLENPVQAEA